MMPRFQHFRIKSNEYKFVNIAVKLRVVRLEKNKKFVVDLFWIGSVTTTHRHVMQLLNNVGPQSFYGATCPCRARI